MAQKTHLLWTRVDGNIRFLVEKIAESQGLTVSEYVRQLIIEDLDKRSVFTALLKQHMAAHNKQAEAQI